MIQRISPASAPPRGTLRVPGDKSLSHRAVLFASMAEGHSVLTGVLDSEDVRATITACETLGAHIELLEPQGPGLTLRVGGWGAVGPRQPSHPIDCGNSGTTARLLMGVLARYPVTVTLTGDASLSRRPMLRVIEPLSRMGARFDAQRGYTLPVTVHGTDRVEPLSYASSVASAQVKTAILLAGLGASGATHVTEPAPSRDHTERLFPAFGVSVGVDEHRGVSVHGPTVLRPHDVAVPGDPSSAAFIVAAALLTRGGDVTVVGASLNPTRIGFLRVLERMGADVTLVETASEGVEPVGSMTARHGNTLTAARIEAHEVASLVDEIPVLALVAAHAEGTTRFDGVSELRVKESDRLAAIVEGLSALGVTVRAGEEWLEVDGPAVFGGATLDSLGDHRLAMVWALAGLAGTAEVAIERFEAVNVSYPAFLTDIERLTAP